MVCPQLSHTYTRDTGPEIQRANRLAERSTSNRGGIVKRRFINGECALFARNTTNRTDLVDISMVATRLFPRLVRHRAARGMRADGRRSSNSGGPGEPDEKTAGRR